MAKSTNGGRRRRPKRRGRHPVVRKLMDWTGWKRSARLARGALFVREVRLTLAALAVGFVAGVVVGLWLAPTDGSPEQAAQGPAAPTYETAPPPAVEAPPEVSKPAETAPPEQEASRSPQAETPSGAVPAWRANAASYADPAGRPMVAVVIDDMGVDRAHSDRAAALPAPLTLAFLPYARDLGRQVRAARAAGHEILAHVPAEPGTIAVDPGPHYLAVGRSEVELRRNIAWNLAQLDGFVGVNNHMGSRFTADPTGMTVLMDELATRGLLFLDSRTTAATVGATTASAHGVPYAERDVFLDNDPSVEAILVQLAELEAEARRTGSAIGIGHPHEATIEALALWLPEARKRGIALVPVSAVVAERRGLAQAHVPGG